MPWFKIDDGFHGHPKVYELSLASVGLWTLAGSWCAKYLTDGAVTPKAIMRLGGTDEQCAELVKADLWIPSEGGYQFKDWDDYQPLKDDVEAEREAARERMKRVRANKKGVSPVVQPNVQANNIGTFEETSEEVRVTPSQSQSHPNPVLFPVPSGPEKTGRRAPELPLPVTWKPSALHEEKAREKYLDVNLQAETFRNHAETNDRRARNWNAAFNNWLIKATPGAAPMATKSSPWSKEFHNG